MKAFPTTDPAGSGRTRPGGSALRRGFSLIELMVVVIIVSVLAALAIPSVTLRLRDRYTKEVSQRVETWYRTARMRSMGRGSAVLVRFDNGTVQVREARLGPTAADPNCAPMPVNNCRGNSWVAASPATDNILVQGLTLDPGVRAEYANVVIEAYGPQGSNGNNAQLTSQMDVCFTPMGRTFIRFDQTANFNPMLGAARIRVYRDDGTGNPEGLDRSVLLMPNGSSRLKL